MFFCRCAKAGLSTHRSYQSPTGVTMVRHRIKLMPRLGALQHALPHQEILVDASVRLVDLHAEDIDCAIRYGLGAYPGLVADRLFAEAVVPVCSPEFATRHNLHPGIASLEGVPLLHDDGPERDPGCPGWREWLAGAGFSPAAAQGGMRLNQSSLVLDAAVAGHGLALGKARLAEGELAAGRLVSPLGTPQPVEFSYSFVTSPSKAALPRIELFRRWLQAEAAASPAAAGGFLPILPEMTATAEYRAQQA
jgi:LysR family glycine cleavage system transcriptional activator